MSVHYQAPITHVLIKESYGTFGYNPALNCIFHLWKGFLSLDEVKHVAETTNAYIQQMGVTNIIADHCGMEMFSDKVSLYISDVWFPTLEKIGIKTTFVVMSSETFTQLAAEETHEQAKHKSAIEIRHFDSMLNAVQAIREYNQQYTTTHYAYPR